MQLNRDQLGVEDLGSLVLPYSYRSSAREPWTEGSVESLKVVSLSFDPQRVLYRGCNTSEVTSVKWFGYMLTRRPIVHEVIPQEWEHVPEPYTDIMSDLLTDYLLNPTLTSKRRARVKTMYRYSLPNRDVLARMYDIAIADLSLLV